VKIIYLHGFASIGSGEKSAAMIAEFGVDNVIAPDLPFDADEVEHTLTAIIGGLKSYPIILVGTSLGGFWANYMAQRWDIPCILINPSMSPSVSMKHRIGTQCNYYTGDEIVVTEENVQKFIKREQYLAKNTNGALIHLFVAKDDAVLNPADMIAAVPYFASRTIKETGGHRFEGNWPEVIQKIKEIV